MHEACDDLNLVGKIVYTSSVLTAQGLYAFGVNFWHDGIIHMGHAVGGCPRFHLGGGLKGLCQFLQGKGTEW